MPLAKAIDIAVQVGKTPIVVNDSRGFFTSRVIGTFLNEAIAMVGEGISPSSIEQAGQQAGYPAAPLQLMDELTLTLPRKIREETKAAGYTIPFEDMKERMLFAEAIDTVRCLDEGVLRSVADANVGSILGIGFPAWTGGVVQYINGYEGRTGTGPRGFVIRASWRSATGSTSCRPRRSWRRRRRASC